MTWMMKSIATVAKQEALAIITGVHGDADLFVVFVVVLGDGDVVVGAKELAFWGLFGLRVAGCRLSRRVKGLGRARRLWLYLGRTLYLGGVWRILASWSLKRLVLGVREVVVVAAVIAISACIWKAHDQLLIERVHQAQLFLLFLFCKLLFWRRTNFGADWLLYRLFR